MKTTVSIEVGRRIRYPGDMANIPSDGVIVAVTNQHFDAILFDGRLFRHVFNAAFSGLRPWTLYDRLHGPALIDAMRHKVAAVAAARALAEADAKQKHADAVASLIAAHPQLTPCSDTNRYDNVVGANLRTMLRAGGIKASVRKERGSMVSSYCITVATDSTDAQVEEAESIGRRFELGRFDGMDDCYHYAKYNAWTDAFGGVRYVNVYRGRA